MKVLFIHNRYRDRGGEDQVVAHESALLGAMGHDVGKFEVDNRDLHGPWELLRAVASAAYSETGKRQVSDALGRFRPDLAHVHNFFPQLSPSVYDACLDAGVPVVQTLHNFRTICPGALLMRDGKVCEECVHNSAYRAVRYGCYRGSRLATLGVARMVETHRKRKTWQHKVARFIALTEFAKKKFVAAGFPADRIRVKPNFLASVPPIDADRGRATRHGVLFVGRLSGEKGMDTLLGAWGPHSPSLRIAGHGPLAGRLRREPRANVTLLGHLDRPAVSAEMARAAVLVVPSIWYEGLPMVTLEAFAHGLPVVASRIGGLAEVVTDGRTGLLFEAGNSSDLAMKVQWAVEHPDEMRRMGEGARKEYETRYAPEANYRQLISVYEEAICTCEYAG